MSREDLYYDEGFKQWELSPKEMDEFENTIYNQALEDTEKRYREWSKSEYGKIVSDDALPIRVLRSLRK